MLLRQILDVRAIGFDKTKNEYINNIQAILRRAYRNIMNDISQQLLSLSFRCFFVHITLQSHNPLFCFLSLLYFLGS